MKYFKINESSDLGVIGHYPQTKFKEGYNPRLPDSHWQVKVNSFPDFVPKLELEINPKARPTNFLEKTSVTFGLIVDLDVREILEQHILPRHHFYPIKVYYKNELLEYYWFHCIYDDFWNLINTENTVIKRYRNINPDEKHFFSLNPNENLDSIRK